MSMDSCLGQNYKLCPELQKRVKSPFRRCVDNLSQKKFDDREYEEVNEALCGKKPYLSKRDLPFNEDIVDENYNNLVNK